MTVDSPVDTDSDLLFGCTSIPDSWPQVTKLRKLLTEERKKSQGETVRLNETSHLFEQVGTLLHIMLAGKLRSSVQYCVHYATNL